MPTYDVVCLLINVGLPNHKRVTRFFFESANNEKKNATATIIRLQDHDAASFSTCCPEEDINTPL